MAIFLKIIHTYIYIYDDSICIYNVRISVRIDSYFVFHQLVSIVFTNFLLAWQLHRAPSPAWQPLQPVTVFLSFSDALFLCEKERLKELLAVLGARALLLVIKGIATVEATLLAQALWFVTDRTSGPRCHPWRSTVTSKTRL